MAILHQATLSPSKLEMLAEYLPTLPGIAPAVGDDLVQVGAYRFDDPAGEVGVETHLLMSSAGKTIQMPLTYRAAPMDGGDDCLLGTLEHSVLGRRWVYNGCGDPVYVKTLVHAILTGGSEAELVVETPDGPVVRESPVSILGSGSAGARVPDVGSILCRTEGTESTIETGELSVTVRHVLDDPGPDGAAGALTGTWPGADEPVVLAYTS